MTRPIVTFAIDSTVGALPSTIASEARPALLRAVEVGRDLAEICECERAERKRLAAGVADGAEEPDALLEGPGSEASPLLPEAHPGREAQSDPASAIGDVDARGEDGVHPPARLGHQPADPPVQEQIPDHPRKRLDPARLQQVPARGPQVLALPLEPVQRRELRAALQQRRCLQGEPRIEVRMHPANVLRLRSRVQFGESELADGGEHSEQGEPIDVAGAHETVVDQLRQQRERVGLPAAYRRRSPRPLRG